MKTLITLLAAAVAVPLLDACSSFAEKTAAQNLNAQECKAKFEETNGVFIDLRSADEFNAGMIQGAVNVDINEGDFKSKLADYNRNQTYFVYSEKGELNSKALSLMKESGFKKVYELEGGLESWKQEGYEVSSPVGEEVARSEMKCVGAKPIIDYKDGKVVYKREVDISCDTSFEVVTKGHGFEGVGKFASSGAYNQEVDRIKAKKGSRK